MTMALIVWTAAAFIWWVIALVLLAFGCHKESNSSTAPRPGVTIFKPLPPVGNEDERAAIAEAIDSFVAQLTPGDELIVGINEVEAPAWQSAIEQWQSRWPAARIQVFARETPRQCANPKIAWLQVLAPEARCELWLWSDADVIAPAGFLDAICGQLLSGHANAVTAPYRISTVRRGQEMFDTLFVNLEFLPGTILLGKLGRNEFAYGAATVFRAGTFSERVDWVQLGAALADDNKIGELLQPVTLGQTVVSTFTRPVGWVAAWQHYYRWQKTVRWCRPGGYAALLMLMPMFGWALACTLMADATFAIQGLIGVFVGELLVAVTACGLVGCRLPARTWPGLVLWPVARPLTWLLVWLPLPVLWSGSKRKWFGPQQRGV